MKTLTKARATFAVKALDEGTRTFTGLASTWDEDLGGDVIHRGAFKKTLDDWRASKKVMPLIDQHDYRTIRSVVGKLVSAKETAEGLETEWEVIEGADGDEIMRRIKGGFIDSLSIGYEAVKYEYERPEGADPWDVIRHLKEVKLYEVSLVIWPMNPGAVIDQDSIKSLTSAAREGRAISDEEAFIFRALPDEEKERIRALRSESEPPAKGTQTGDEAAHFEQTAALKLRIQMLNLRRAAA